MSWMPVLLALTLTSFSVFAEDAHFSVVRKDKLPNPATRLDDSQLKDLVSVMLNIDYADGTYSDVGVTTHDDYYVVHLFEAKTYRSECVRLQRERSGDYTVIKHYVYAPDDQVPCVTGQCPDESVKILVSGSFSDPGHVSRQYVMKAYQALKQGGVNVHHLGGHEENRQSIINWLSCKNLVLWGRIGHGSQTQISFAGAYADGAISCQELGSLPLANKLLILNCCQVHNPNFTSAVIQRAKAKFLCGGDSMNLEMYKSEPVWYSIIMGGVRDKKEFGALVRAGNPQLGEYNKYGFTRHPSCQGQATYPAGGNQPCEEFGLVEEAISSSMGPE